MGIIFSALSLKVTGIVILCMTCVIEVVVHVWYVGAVDWECRN